MHNYIIKGNHSTVEEKVAELMKQRDQLRAEVERLTFYIATTIQPREYAKVIEDLRAELNAATAERDAAIARAERAEVESVQLLDQLAAAGQREAVAIASWDEERGRALREGARVVEWRDRAERAEAEVKRLGHLEAVLRSCAFDKDGTAWKTVCGWWSKKYDAVERQMSENATRAELAEAELAAERARTKQIATALTDAISTYFGADKLVTAERIEAWQAALKEGTK